MTQAQILAACKLACRVSSSTLDSEFNELIAAAYYDLENSGVATVEGAPYTPDNSDQLVVTAVKTFVKLHMGDLLDNAEAERLETSYWYQVAKLRNRRYSSSVIPGGES
jgi:hypothetical protein